MLEINNTVTAKNAFHGLINRLEIAEERISELEKQRDREKINC